MEEVMRALLAITASMFIAASVFGTFDSVRAQDKAGPEAKLKAMGIDVTKYESRPVANYANGVQVGNLLFMSGVGPRNPDGTGIIGKVGAELTLSRDIKPLGWSVWSCWLTFARRSAASIE